MATMHSSVSFLFFSRCGRSSLPSIADRDEKALSYSVVDINTSRCTRSARERDKGEQGLELVNAGADSGMTRDGK